MADLENLYKAAHSGNLDDLYKQANNAPNPYSGGLADYIFNKDSAGRIMNAFGQSAKQGWGAGVVDPNLRGITAANDEYIDQQKGWGTIHKTVAKAINQTFLRPLYTIADAASEVVTGGYSALASGVAGATEEAANQLTAASKETTPSILPGGHYLQGVAGEILGAASV